MKATRNISDFYPNNISFRVASSKLLERFKQSQNFVLSEIEFGDYHFSRTSKELALVYTDTMFNWLLALETKIIREKYITDLTLKKRDCIRISLDKHIEYIAEVARQNSDIFDSGFIKVWDQVRFKIEDKMAALAKDDKKAGTIAFFTESVNLIIDSIEELRLDVYEIDYLINGGKKPFLCVTDMDSDFMRDGESRITKKAVIYIDRFDCKDFELRNYTSSTSFFRRFVNIMESEIPISGDTNVDD